MLLQIVLCGSTEDEKPIISSMLQLASMSPGPHCAALLQASHHELAATSEVLYSFVSDNKIALW